MIFKKTILTILIVLFTGVCILWAGDSADFVDLGFSPDGRIYMFGQYGVLSPSLRPWAELYVVDVAANNFVQNGRVSYTQTTPIRAGQDGSGVLYQLLGNNAALVNRHRINNQNQGQPLYISRSENPPDRGEIIDFRDFVSGRAFKAHLIPVISGTGQNIRSSFHINMEVTSQNGQTRTYRVGSPGFTRDRIASYNIKKVLIDPSGTSIIFVIEMKRVASNGFDIRYMVEAQRL